MSGVRAIALAMTLAACSGCTRKVAPADAGAAPSPVAGLTSAQASQVLARVGTRTITVGDFVAALEHMDSFDRIRYQAPERRKELLEEMIDVALLADEARSKGYDKDPEVEQETREILRDAVLKQVRAEAPKPSEIAEAEVRAYYEAHRGDFRDPERRRVSAVVLRNEAAANAALAEARAGSASDWGALVRSRSIDSSAAAGGPPELAGDLGFVSPPGDPRGVNARVPEEVRAAVYEISEVGGVLPRVVAAAGKFYVVRLQSKTPPHDRSLDDAARMIRVKLAQEKMHAREEEFVAGLEKQYPVTIDESALRDVKTEPAEAGK
jgi:parvulin-like peptidyl-prolyl isomerase